MEGMHLLLALILIRQFDLPDMTWIKKTRYEGNGPVVGYILLIRQFDLPDVTCIKRTRYGGNGPVVGYPADQHHWTPVDSVYNATLVQTALEMVE